MRASQLVDLVYKQGQAGVTKATVTITFYNGDKDKSPVGFEKYDEIIVRRQVRDSSINFYVVSARRYFLFKFFSLKGRKLIFFFLGSVMSFLKNASFWSSEYIPLILQIVVNGRNTYTINGTAATNSRVADMFRSVGLNVNNPHFLIMQGRITKVLNMKPVEVRFTFLHFKFIPPFG